MKKDKVNIKTYLFPLWVDKITTLKGVIFKGLATIYLMSIPRFIKYMTLAVEQGDIWLIKKYLLFFVIYSFVLFVVRARIKDRGWVTLGAWYRRILQDTYIGKYIALDNNYAEKLGTGKAIAVINKGIDVWGRSLKDGVERVIEISIALVSTLIILFVTGWYYPLIFLITIIFTLLFAYHQNKKVLQGRRKRKEISVQYTNHIVKLFMSKFEVLQSDKWLHEKEKIRMFMHLTIDATKKYSLQMLYLFFGSRVFLYVISLGVIGIMGVQVIHHSISFANFASVITVLTMINAMINRLLSYFKNISRDRVHVEKMVKFFNGAPEIYQIESKTSFVYQKGTISLKNIHFGYDGNEVFKGLSLDIEPGKKTAFVGPSGVGKSTLIKLIAGYLQPDSGDIVIDRQKLSDVSLKSYYTHIGYLTQEPSVFDGTIYENLTYALDMSLYDNKEHDLDTHLKQVIKSAKCEFIYDFPKGMETEIGERGVRLSGGQKQRLAIAKIMLKNPDIILLDEPTSALDSFSEEQINIALENLFAGKTVIIVAHRLQTVKQSDIILFFENGKVSEKGTHDELIALGGKYKKMLDLQSGF